jgi:hypothetical protein
MCTPQPAAGPRRITPLEARRMALDIHHRAEVGRAAAAQTEAKQGTNWEEMSQPATARPGRSNRE